MRQYLFTILLTGALALVLSWGVWQLSMRYKLYPGIRERDVHQTPTPRLGGIAIYLAIVLAALATAANPYFAILWADPAPILSVLVAATLIVAVGAADDVWDLDWFLKLGVQFIAAGIITIGGGLQILSVPFGGVWIGSSWLSIVVTMIIIVTVMNAVNFIDGLDGLVAGTGLIAGGVFFAYTYLLVRDTGSTGNFSLASLLTALVIGGCAGFLPLNWRPAKLFMGDSGALLLGLLLGTGTVAITGQITPEMLDPEVFGRSQLVGAFLPVILLPVIVVVLPLTDFLLAVVRRMGAGRSPFSPDRKHLHHRMLDLGHSDRDAVIVFYAWTAVISLSVLLMYIAVREDWPGSYWLGIAFGAVGVVACLIVTVIPSTAARRARRSRALEARP
ncbi:MraY family glycosyltransferase [Microbacterium gorillae]|uniref:MraY family glycosyltransferase n=1 Tax=Microbacterium gorillae TaxID=1231063 RepID=UPI00058E55BD|nr:MraY family glycosyltransferase [Microbacterium gorillae]